MAGRRTGPKVAFTDTPRTQTRERTVVSTHHLAHYRVGAELARYVRSQTGQGVTPVTALQAVVADIAATTPNLAIPLRDLVSRQGFQELIPLAGSGTGELQRKALVDDIRQLYHPDVVQALVEVLNGFLERDEEKDQRQIETRAEKQKPLVGQEKCSQTKINPWKPSNRSIQITGAVIGIIGLSFARLDLDQRDKLLGSLRVLPTEQQQQSVNTRVNPVSPGVTTFPLTVAEPNEEQLKDLLEAWLEGKYRLLADSRHLPPPPQSGYPLLSDLARNPQVEALERQKERNNSAGITEAVKISVESFTVLERSPNRIAAQATLRYSDEVRDRSSRVLSQTPDTTLTNTYVFARDDGRWLLASFKGD